MNPFVVVVVVVAAALVVLVDAACLLDLDRGEKDMIVEGSPDPAAYPSMPSDESASLVAFPSDPSWHDLTCMKIHVVPLHSDDHHNYHLH